MCEVLTVNKKLEQAPGGGSMVVGMSTILSIPTEFRWFVKAGCKAAWETKKCSCLHF